MGVTGMKSYLNSKQTTQVTYMSAILAMLVEFLEYDVLSKTERTAFKYAVTHLTKGLKALIDRVGAEDRIKRNLKDNTIVFQSKFNKLNEREYMDKEALFDLLAHCIIHL